MRRYLLIFVVFIACSSPSEKANNRILDFYESLPQMNFPLIFNSKTGIDRKPIHVEDDSILSKLVPTESGFDLWGKLYKANKYYTIVGYIPNDSGSPVILTFDKNGKKIDSFLVYQTTGFGMGFYRSNYAKIFADRKIEFIDSTLTRQINEDGSDEIPGTDSLVVRKKIFGIDKEGFFKEEK